MQHTPRRYSVTSQRRPEAFTILVIDDDPQVLEVATDLLSNSGYRALVASSGQDALAMMQAIRPDLILLDYHMPDIDGVTVIWQLRVDEATRRIPVIALTAGTAEDANKLSRAGSIGVILKPFESGEFLRFVADVLNATVGRRRIEDAT